MRNAKTRFTSCSIIGSNTPVVNCTHRINAMGERLLCSTRAVLIYFSFDRNQIGSCDIGLGL